MRNLDQKHLSKTTSMDESYKTTGIYWEKILSVYEYDFLKSYLHAVFVRNHKDDKIKVFRCITHSSLNHRPQTPNTLDAGSSRFQIIGDGVLEVTLMFQQGMYEINVSKETLNDGRRVHTAYCLGLSKQATNPRALLEYCLFQAISNSYYKNLVLQLTKPCSDEAMYVKPIDIRGRTLDHLLLPDDCRSSIILFIETLKYFDNINRPLRYLFNGKPGTGKTETIRSIIEACKNIATFLLVEGKCELFEIFELASFFSPAVVCLDDIDLLFGNRNHSFDRHQLGEFLNIMDGFNKNNIFVLATTNDKEWVDAAVSRPGRFDMVLDMDILEPSLYLELIKQRCKDEEIIKLFSDSVLDELQEKHVSGAFVVTLLKHLEINKFLHTNDLNNISITQLIDRMYRGFYKNQIYQEKIGLGTN